MAARRCSMSLKRRSTIWLTRWSMTVARVFVRAPSRSLSGAGPGAGAKNAWLLGLAMAANSQAAVMASWSSRGHADARRDRDDGAACRELRGCGTRDERGWMQRCSGVEGDSGGQHKYSTVRLGGPCAGSGRPGARVGYGTVSIHDYLPRYLVHLPLCVRLMFLSPIRAVYLPRYRLPDSQSTLSAGKGLLHTDKNFLDRRLGIAVIVEYLRNICKRDRLPWCGDS